MLTNDLISQNPFSSLDKISGLHLKPGRLGCVAARAGVGKTAFMVQMAIYNMLKKRSVLHISLAEPVHKVCLRYDDAIQNLLKEHSESQIKELSESLAKKRFVMTFKVTLFNVSTLEERLQDLTAQNIFNPELILIDGLPQAIQTTSTLQQLRNFSEHIRIPAWTTILSHRSDPEADHGLPASVAKIASEFETIILLCPQKDRVQAAIFSEGKRDEPFPLFFWDPSNMRITEE